MFAPCSPRKGWNGKQTRQRLRQRQTPCLCTICRMNPQVPLWCPTSPADPRTDDPAPGLSRSQRKTCLKTRRSTAQRARKGDFLRHSSIATVSWRSCWPRNMRWVCPLLLHGDKVNSLSLCKTVTLTDFLIFDSWRMCVSHDPLSNFWKLYTCASKLT